MAIFNTQVVLLSITFSYLYLKYTTLECCSITGLHIQNMWLHNESKMKYGKVQFSCNFF